MIVMQPIARICRFVPTACLFTFMCGFIQPAFAQAHFPVSFAASASDLTQTERNQLTSHYQAAGQEWAQNLGIFQARSIEILIGVENIATANASSATSVFFGVFGDRNTFEQGAAYELRTGLDPNGGSADVVVNIGLNYLRNELWFDPDPTSRTAQVPLNKTDAMTSALHEMGHALAYSGWANGLGVPPEDFWSTFDRWMQVSAPTLFEGPASMIVYGSAPELTTNNINHWGNAPGLNQATESTQSSQPVLWRDGAPVPRNNCTGLVSVDRPASQSESSSAVNLLDQLMNGVSFTRGTRYYISDLDMAALHDAGLPIDTEMIFRNGFEN